MTKDIHLQYVTDEEGKKQAVVIPFHEWQNILQELVEFRELRTIKKRLKAAFKQVEEIKQGKSPRVTLNEFLNES